MIIFDFWGFKRQALKRVASLEVENESLRKQLSREMDRLTEIRWTWSEESAKHGGEIAALQNDLATALKESVELKERLANLAASSLVLAEHSAKSESKPSGILPP